MQQKRLLSLIFNALWFYSDFDFDFGSTNVKTISQVTSFYVNNDMTLLMRDKITNCISDLYRYFIFPLSF